MVIWDKFRHEYGDEYSFSICWLWYIFVDWLVGFTLILSDVVGDDLDAIASGPTVPDSSSFSDCKNIFLKYNIIDKIPKIILNHIESILLTYY